MLSIPITAVIVLTPLWWRVNAQTQAQEAIQKQVDGIVVLPAPIPVSVGPVIDTRQPEGVVVSEIRPMPPKPSSPPPIPTKYDFEVVKVDRRGRINERVKREMRGMIEEFENGVVLELVKIPGGSFMMGTSIKDDETPEAQNDEFPQHQVTIPGFYIGKFEVTQAQWRFVAGLPKISTDLNPDPSYFKGESLPVEQVSWYEAIEFCNRLSRKTGRKYRLPSEAEWEYACRAGTTTPFAFGKTITPEYVNYNGNYPYGSARTDKYRQRTTAVGSLGVANDFGLYDMHGNVFEWCLDVWHKNYEGAPVDGGAWESSTVFNNSIFIGFPLPFLKGKPSETDGNPYIRLARGGSWYWKASFCRSAHRYRFHSNHTYHNIGFRVVMHVT
jgi:formylglycine-generating enzyme required for sulfatase activity